ncbi:unnamed protein product [Microthlaspi erraticum]|uniref:MOB kinase activator-like 1A n=1 Tax=Microthlaspi erraticum TaxID=1685480 RepID=A0A6D2L3K1_9BRAS|nr:unnamed protein product [Microthlaspi erraticum]
MAPMQLSVCTTTLCLDMSAFSVRSSANQKTASPSEKRKVNPLFGSKGSELERLTTKTLEKGNLKEAVKLPAGEDINQWLGIHTVDFCNQINHLYASVGDFCTPKTCPIMNAGSGYKYKWADGVTINRHITVSAPEYVEYLEDWIRTQMGDKTIFPQKTGAPFPPEFKDSVKLILKRLFRVYAHIYHSHFKKIVHLEAEAHLNTSFKHFVLFVTEFKLVDKVELDALEELVEKILDP